MSDKYYSDEDGADNTRFGRQQRERDAFDEEAKQYEGRTVASHQDQANPFGSRRIGGNPHEKFVAADAKFVPGEPVDWKQVDPEASTWKAP